MIVFRIGDEGGVNIVDLGRRGFGRDMREEQQAVVPMSYQRCCPVVRAGRGLTRLGRISGSLVQIHSSVPALPRDLCSAPAGSACGSSYISVIILAHSFTDPIALPTYQMV